MTYLPENNHLDLARGVLLLRPMSRWLVALVLVVAGATASAQPGKPAPTRVAAERRAAELTAQRAQLAQTYATELEAIDRLKKQRASWRRDRELRDSLAAANETATRLAATTAELGRLAAQLGPRPAAGAAGVKVHRIVLPELEVDPLADPEELAQQAAALRGSEAELDRQVIGLDKQAQELDEVAKLRKQHERAGDLAKRDDDQPQRTAQQGGGSRTFGASNDTAAPEATPPSGGGASGGAGGATGLTAGGFESEATVALSGIVDASTIDTLNRAQRSGDPSQRALAAKKARDAVAGRLEQLRKKRAEIEALVKARKQKR